MEPNLGLAEHEFVDDLADRLSLDPADRPRASDWLRVGNTIGALTLRLNLMSEGQVDKVLETQDLEGGYFGEIAVRLGYLTEQQVDRLLELQHFHDQLFTAEQLVVAGRIDVPSLLTRFAQFLEETAT
ncbi:MAG: hypothetical protein ACC645_19395 [Pirellulales bacterium]